MTAESDNYRNGVSLGHDFAEADRRDQAPLGGNAQEILLEALEERDAPRTWRAFKLGVARGYRDSVRTFEHGRWGA